MRSLLAEPLPEQIVTLALPKTASTRAFVAQQHLPPKIRVRLVRVLLASGEVEVLLTTLCDVQVYPAREFKEVYGERWAKKRFLTASKTSLKSSVSTARPWQWWSKILPASSSMTLESILTKPEQAALAQQGVARETKDVPQVNRAESYVALLDRVVRLLLSPRSEDEVIAELHHLFRKNPTLQRPGGSSFGGR